MWFVYFIKCGQFIKIGYTQDLERRKSTLQTANPAPLDVLLKLPFETEQEALKTEKYLHSALNQYAVNGEWFDFEKKKPLQIVNKQIVDGILDLMHKENFIQISFQQFFSLYWPEFNGKRKIAIDKNKEYLLQMHNIEVQTTCAQSEVRVNGARGFRCKKIKEE